MELFGISFLQYMVLIVGMLLIYFILREAELRETIITFSEMIQLLEQWINNPQNVELAQHSKDINDHLERLWHQKGLRFTLIRGDGVVLLDGAVKEHKDMDNHLSRPEIQDALVNGRGVAVRHSNMMNDTMIYVAEPVKTQWGTLYLRLGSLPGIIPHNNITFIILAIVAVTSVILIKLC